MNIINTQSSILSTLKHKDELKQLVNKNTVEVFNQLKEVVKKIHIEYNSELESMGHGSRVEFKERGDYEFEIRVASDILVFSMYSNVFQFNRDHNVWQNNYIKQNPDNSYSGIINIFNFLSDSFKYSRLDDLGYLVARIFVNKEKHYLVEGKRQMNLFKSDLSENIINDESLRQIVETSINYSLNFDLLVPPYENVKIISVNDMFEKIQNAKVRTGKRLGFQYNSDDI
ncbi:MAG: hypothetical protein N4A49_17055 [Marinifilaceae bacterium]|jgi:hypothetical protein|nr:hypothetical protein [Marinifilaceae bacterium]